jgi:hypothetical protein
VAPIPGTHHQENPTMYLGHHPDGSSIQKHSAGGGYPYVLGMREVEGERYWLVIGPGIEGELRFVTHGAAEKAIGRLQAVRDNPDAWAFELEQVATLAGQRLPAVMAGALPATGGEVYWDGMSKAERVRSLMRAGAARRGVPEVRGHTTRPPFALLAAALHQQPEA